MASATSSLHLAPADTPTADCRRLPSSMPSRLSGSYSLTVDAGAGHFVVIFGTAAQMTAIVAGINAAVDAAIPRWRPVLADATQLRPQRVKHERPHP